jgi:hypothetical protein
MAAPLFALPALGKLAGLLGLGGKAAAAKAGAGAVAGTGAKMAAGPAFKGGLGKLLFGDMTKTGVATRLGPDIFFGGLAAAQTPGDLGDKLIAGTTQAVGGGLGGLVPGRIGTALGGDAVGTLADLGGSLAGDVIGMNVGDSVQRGKDKLFGGKGQTAFERMGEKEQQRFANQIRNETLMSMGIGPGYLPGVQDQYLAELGLG